ncbi:MAG: GyrI-like domain-containing protein [Actinomycetota bacterium]|nr:GyrI-like domain-containing protein [Actinomycetota bacterium]
MFEASIKRTYPMTVAFISMRGPYAQIPSAFSRLYAWIAERAMMPMGMPAGVYMCDPATTPEAEATWELWAPIADGTPPFDTDDGSIGVKAIPAGTVASAMHKGPYDEIAPTYEALAAWIIENGYIVAGAPREIYYSDPDEVAIEDTLTEVQFPVQSA